MSECQSPKRSALVLGSDTRSFLSVVRSLGRYGIRVDAAWSVENSSSLRSRYLNQVHQIPTPWDANGAWLPSLDRLIDQQEYDLVVPCGDPSSIPLQRFKGGLRNAARVYLLDDEAFRITQSKLLSTDLASSLGIPVPEHMVVRDLESGSSFASEVGYPVVLKPNESFREDQLLRKQTVVQVKSDHQLRVCLERMLGTGVVQAQAYFEGTGTGVEFLADDGQVLFAFQHLRLHEPQKGGGSSYRASIPLHPAMLEATRQIVCALRYSGVGMVEFRWNRKTDEWIFVEINGRFWGSLPLAIASGADFPTLLYRSRVEGAKSFPQQYRVGICCRNWERDKNWLSEQCLATNRRSTMLRSLATESALGIWRTLRLREYSDTFTWDDPAPGIDELKSIAQSASQGIVRRIRGRIDHLPLTRRVRRGRISGLLASAGRILFVCKGNICRSPFAEFLARRILPPEKVVESCGYYPVAERECPRAACEAASRFGVDLHDHRSRVISGELMDAADLVFVFDQENRDVLVSRYSEYRRKIHYLGSCLSGSVYISDPYGEDVEQFAKCYRKIESALSEQIEPSVQALVGQPV